jgi:predicted transcriptional regulator
MRFRRITIFKTTRPSHANINEELQWLGGSIGLFSLRDKDKSCFRIFITLLKNVKGKQGLTSDQLAANLSLTRGTVVFHLNKLMGAGIVNSEKNHYYLVTENLEMIIDEIKENLDKTLKELKEMAKEIDDRLEL